MGDILALSAAFGSFQVKSSSTSLVIVFVTIRVLPFRLTGTLICSGTLIVSIFRVRAYSDQRQRSMQTCATIHSSTRSTALMSIELVSTEFVAIKPHARAASASAAPANDSLAKPPDTTH